MPRYFNTAVSVNITAMLHNVRIVKLTSIQKSFLSWYNTDLKTVYLKVADAWMMFVFRGDSLSSSHLLTHSLCQSVTHSVTIQSKMLSFQPLPSFILHKIANCPIHPFPLAFHIQSFLMQSFFVQSCLNKSFYILSFPIQSFEIQIFLISSILFSHVISYNPIISNHALSNAIL